jgi:hypothetical protein
MAVDARTLRVSTAALSGSVMDANDWLGLAAALLALVILAGRPVRRAGYVAVAAVLLVLPPLVGWAVVPLAEARGWLSDLDVAWGGALMLLGLLALRRTPREALVCGLALVGAVWPLMRGFGADGAGVWAAGPAGVLALVALRQLIGRLPARGQGHVAGLAGSGAMALGGYFLALVYVLATGATTGEGVRLPPASSAAAGTLVLLALCAAAAAGYFFKQRNGYRDEPL